MDIVEKYCLRTAEEGGAFVMLHPIEHLTKLRCREGLLNEIRANEEINKRFNLGIMRINRWWWSVALIDKDKES